MKRLLLGIALMSGGCTGTIDNTRIEKAQEVCAANGGLASILQDRRIGGTTDAICNNGAKFNILD